MSSPGRNIALVAFVILAGCAGPSRGAAGPSDASAANYGGAGDRGAPAKQEDSCPGQVPGVKIALNEVAGGYAITFTAPPEQVNDLRRRVRAMAAFHEAAPSHDIPSNGDASTSWPHVATHVEDIDGGARLRFDAPTRADAEALHVKLDTQVDEMRRGRCPFGEPGTFASRRR